VQWLIGWARVVTSLDLRLLRLFWESVSAQQPHRLRLRISTPAHVASLVCASSWSRQALEEGCGRCDELGSELRIRLHQFHA